MGLLVERAVGGRNDLGCGADGRQRFVEVLGGEQPLELLDFFLQADLATSFKLRPHLAHGLASLTQSGEALVVQALGDLANAIMGLLERRAAPGQGVHAVVGRTGLDHGQRFSELLNGSHDRQLISLGLGLDGQDRLHLLGGELLQGLGDGVLVHVHRLAGEGFVALDGTSQRLAGRWA